MKYIPNPDSELKAGKKAREQGKGREVCPPNLEPRLRFWWLAGWHDMDMELSSQWVQ